MNQKIHTVLVLLFITILSSISSAQVNSETFSKPEGFELRVMTYNVNGLPWPLKAKKAVLFKEIARLIQAQRANGTAPHVLMIQEGFRKDISNLIENAGYKYVLKGPNSKLRRNKDEGSSALTNSGLYILSDFPIEASHSIVFGRDCSGSDCYANKGALHAQINIPAIGLVDFFNTHFNSVKSAGTGDNKVHAAQHKQLAAATEFFKSLITTERPAFFAGDFNIKSTSPVYNYLLNSMQPLTDVARFCQAFRGHCTVDSNTTEDELMVTNDYQFYKQSSASKVYPFWTAKTMREKLGERELSDHLALSASYIFYK